MPVHLGVPVFLRELPDRGPLHSLKGLSPVRTVGDPLGKGLSPAPFRLVSRAGIEIDLRLAVQPEKALFVHDPASGIDRPVLIGIQDGPLSFPVKQVRAHRVAPAHVLPSGVKGIMLVIKMVGSILIKQPVGIVDPSRIRREVDQRMGLTDLRDTVRQTERVQKTFRHVSFHKHLFSRILFHIQRRIIVESIKAFLIPAHGDLKFKGLPLRNGERNRFRLLFRADGDEQIFSVDPDRFLHDPSFSSHSFSRKPVST